MPTTRIVVASCLPEIPISTATTLASTGGRTAMLTPRCLWDATDCARRSGEHSSARKPVSISSACSQHGSAVSSSTCRVGGQEVRPNTTLLPPGRRAPAPALRRAAVPRPTLSVATRRRSLCARNRGHPVHACSNLHVAIRARIPFSESSRNYFRPICSGRAYVLTQARTSKPF